MNVMHDPNATWIYWNDIYDSSLDTINMDWVWERLRLRRDYLLSVSDWRVVSDAPWEVSSWIIYRQALRDLPSVTIDPRYAEWPKEPLA